MLIVFTLLRSLNPGALKQPKISNIQVEAVYKRLHHPDRFLELEEYDNKPLSFFKPYAEDKALDSSSCPS